MKKTIIYILFILIFSALAFGLPSQVCYILDDGTICLNSSNTFYSFLEIADNIGNWSEDQVNYYTSAQTDANDNDTIGLLSCSTNEIAKYNGSDWVCASDELGAGDTTGYYNNLTNFTTYLVDGALCTYNATADAFECTTTELITNLTGYWNNVSNWTDQVNYSLIVNEFSGCSGTEYLGADGNCHSDSTNDDVSSNELDNLCSSDNQILKRVGGTWQCAIDETGNGSINMSSFNQTQFTNNGTIISILESWLTTYINNWFGVQTTDNLTEGTNNKYDNTSWNESYANTLYLIPNDLDGYYNDEANITCTDISGLSADLCDGSDATGEFDGNVTDNLNMTREDAIMYLSGNNSLLTTDSGGIKLKQSGHEGKMGIWWNSYDDYLDANTDSCWIVSHYNSSSNSNAHSHFSIECLSNQSGTPSVDSKFTISYGYDDTFTEINFPASRVRFNSNQHLYLGDTFEQAWLMQNGTSGDLEIKTNADVKIIASQLDINGSDIANVDDIFSSSGASVDIKPDTTFRIYPQDQTSRALQISDDGSGATIAATGSVNIDILDNLNMESSDIYGVDEINATKFYENGEELLQKGVVGVNDLCKWDGSQTDCNVDTSAEINTAITDNTGSNLLVFSDNPTLQNEVRIEDSGDQSIYINSTDHSDVSIYMMREGDGYIDWRIENDAAIFSIDRSDDDGDTWSNKINIDGSDVEVDTDLTVTGESTFSDDIIIEGNTNQLQFEDTCLWENTTHFIIGACS